MFDPPITTTLRLDVAPFWQSISVEEYGAFVGRPMQAIDLALAPGWEIAVYSTRLGTDRRSNMLGWVNGPFAIAEAAMDEDATLGQLWHLPTGNLVGHFADALLAAFASAVVSDLADWSGLSVLRAGDLGARVRARLNDTGFYHRIIPVPADKMIPVWFREIGDLN